MNLAATSAFHLPDRLAAKAHPTLVASDEEHFAAIARTVGDSIADASVRLDRALSAPSGVGGEAVERDLEIHRLNARLAMFRRYGIDEATFWEEGDPPYWVAKLTEWRALTQSQSAYGQDPDKMMALSRALRIALTWPTREEEAQEFDKLVRSM